MRPLDPGIQSLVRSVIGTLCQLTDRLGVTVQLVRDDHARCPKSRGQPSQEALGCLGVSPWLLQNIKHITIRIHRAPQHILAPLIGTKTSSRCHLSAVNGQSRLIQPEKCGPNQFTHFRTVSRLTATPRKQVLFICSAENKAMVSPNSIGNNLTGETIAFQARHIG